MLPTTYTYFALLMFQKRLSSSSLDERVAVGLLHTRGMPGGPRVAIYTTHFVFVFVFVCVFVIVIVINLT